MKTFMTTRQLEQELIARELVPDGCRLLEVRIEPNAVLAIRYEVMVSADRLGLFADALKAAALETMADDERNRRAQAADDTLADAI